MWRGRLTARKTGEDWDDEHGNARHFTRINATDPPRIPAECLAIPNPPGVTDLRGLTEREAQVVRYAALGEKHQTIAHRLGISRSTVTKAVRSAMRKLRVKTHAELVTRIAPLLRSTVRR